MWQNRHVTIPLWLRKKRKKKEMSWDERSEEAGHYPQDRREKERRKERYEIKVKQKRKHERMGCRVRMSKKKNKR